MSATPKELEGKYILLSARPGHEADGRYTAFCDELGIATCAMTEDAALDRLAGAIGHLLNIATERGDIIALLESKSIRLYSIELSKLGTVRRIGTDPAPSWITFPQQMLFGTTRHSGHVSVNPALQLA